MIPIFSSDASFGRSILTVSEPDALSYEKPISIFTIADEYDLEKIWLCDTSFFNFVSAYRQADRLGKQLIFGIKFEIVENAKNQNEEESETSSMVRVWMKNSEGYKDLIRLYSISSQKENFYFRNRIDWKILENNFTDNLYITFDFYNNFLYRSLFHGKSIFPDISGFPCSFEVSSCDLPMDDLLKPRLLEYCKTTEKEIVETHPIFYYDKSSFLAYQIFRLACDRRSTYKKLSIDEPEYDHMASDQFCFEAFCRKTQREFIPIT